MENLYVTFGRPSEDLRQLRRKYARKSKRQLWKIAQAKSPPLFSEWAYKETTRLDIVDELICGDMEQEQIRHRERERAQ